ncbi:MAG: hypothetical protein ACYC63_17195 [Armatimonadota bacterium]
MSVVPAEVPDVAEQLVTYALAMRCEGQTYQALYRELSEAGWPTPLLDRVLRSIYHLPYTPTQNALDGVIARCRREIPKRRLPLRSAALVPEEPFNNSGTDEDPPKEVADLGWCWGASLPTTAFWWCITHRVWIGFLLLLPLVNVPVLVWLGLNGYCLAWHNRHFSSFRDFHEKMRAWSAWGFLLLIFALANFTYQYLK